MSIESIESDDKLFERFCVRRPPELTRERLRPTLPLILAELGRLDALKPSEADSCSPATSRLRPVRVPDGSLDHLCRKASV